MIRPTPDQLRKTEAARDAVERYWYVDGKTKELRRRPMTGGVAQFLNVFWKKRHTVWEFYWWIRYRQGGADMAPLENPINSDNMRDRGLPVQVRATRRLDHTKGRSEVFDGGATRS